MGLCSALREALSTKIVQAVSFKEVSCTLGSGTGIGHMVLIKTLHFRDCLYEGVCDTIRLRERKFDYKYFVRATDKRGREHIYWEDLHKTETLRSLELTGWSTSN